MTTQPLQKIADDLTKALEKIEDFKMQKDDAQAVLETTPAFKAAQKVQQNLEKAEGEVAALREQILMKMKEDGEKSINSGDYNIHTAEKVNVELKDEDALFAWLKKAKKYSEYIKTVEQVDKRALNKYVMDMHNDRQLPPAKQCGVEVVPNVYIVVKKTNE